MKVKEKEWKTTMESVVKCEKTSLIMRWQELVKYQQNFEQSYNSMRFYLWFIDRYGKDRDLERLLYIQNGPY